MSIRYAVPPDAPRIADIYNQYVGKNTLDTIPRTSDWFLEIINTLDEREAMLVIEYDGTVAGYGVLKKYSWKEGYHFAGETSVFMDGSFRNKGLGNQLKKALIEKAKALHYKHLTARIMANNTVSIHYNLKLGYEWVGVQKNIGFVDGEWFDVAILQLVLE